MSKVRDSMKNSIGMKSKNIFVRKVNIMYCAFLVLNNSEQMNLLINISEDKIDELVNNTLNLYQN